MRELKSEELLEHLLALQQLLYRLVGCQPEGAAPNSNYLVQYALALVLKESFKIYCAINDGIINLVDKVNDQASFSVSTPEVSRVHLAEYQEYLRNHTKIRNRSTDQQLRADLIEEIWNHFQGVNNAQVDYNNIGTYC